VAREIAKPASNVRLLLAPSDAMPGYDPSQPDLRLRELVRVLARQAARKFVKAEQERDARKRLRK